MAIATWNECAEACLAAATTRGETPFAGAFRGATLCRKAFEAVFRPGTRAASPL